MVVLAIMTVLFVLVAPVITSLSGNVTAASVAIQGAFEQARTYAVANNTYTWVGIFEEDGTKPSSRNSAQPGAGRIVICVVASKDGTSIYSKANAENQEAQTLPSASLIQIGKLIKLENVHVVDASAQAVGKRAARIIQQGDLIGLASGVSLFSFGYPLSGSTLYTFGGSAGAGANGIVQFNPQGEAISNVGSLANPSVNLEIAVRAAHGTHADNAANLIALDVSGLTGQTTLYRP
ncbi:hypothetical protein SAMN05444156_2440 [Verrucomicrobium sp. GAS474]|nr:hypothetical protein SAMN05444156_2440 [Verrucomicrobium sp. GAS474]